ncbi:MAG TPA: hypothetical protein VFC78_08730 [Tepidisphaeraceae bacterium]|nr:hypothetical protein [Tepidisphaeraceae bacterium]
MLKHMLALLAMVAFVGFVGTAKAAPSAKPKHHKGHFVKVDGTTLTYKAGAKGTGKERTVTVDDKTKLTFDQKEIKLADLKADTYLEITEESGVATKIVALSKVPTKSKTAGNSGTDQSGTGASNGK